MVMTEKEVAFDRKLGRMNKEELIKEIHSKIAQIKRYSNMVTNKTAQIRNFRLRLKHIRDGLDYFLLYPWSKNTGTRGRKHPRDRK